MFDESYLLQFILFFEVGENKKKDKKEDGCASQTSDTADEISNGVVANMETEKIDSK